MNAIQIEKYCEAYPVIFQNHFPTRTITTHKNILHYEVTKTRTYTVPTTNIEYQP